MTRPTIDENEPHIIFSRFSPATQSRVDSADFQTLPPIGGQPAPQIHARLVAAFDATTTQDLTANPPPPIATLRDIIIEQFRQDAGGFQSLFGTWPPQFPDGSSTLATLLLFVATLLRDVARPLEVLRWLTAAVCPADWHGSSPADSDILYVVSMTKVKGKVQYAMLDRKRYLRVDATNNDGREMRCVMSAKVKNVAMSGKGLKFTFDDNTTKSIAMPNPGSWVTHPPFPLVLSSLEAPFPLPLLIAFFNCLTGSDMIVFRALIHFGVIPLSDGVPFIDALIDVFAYAGKIDQFLVTVIGMEFSKAELKYNTVLRSNTHVTNLFKAWLQRFDRPYFDLFLANAIDYIVSVGDIGLSHPENADIEKAETLLFTVFEQILASGPVIPAEIRHLASVLRALAIARFNSKQATYNTLAGFICLRFITATIADPVLFRPHTEPFSPEIMRMLMPFSQLLQTPVNLAPLDGRFEGFAGMNRRIEAEVWPKLINWVLSVGDLPEKPKYEQPREADALNSITVVLTALSSHFPAFKAQYEALVAEEPQAHPITWSLSALFSSLFEEAR
jgi:hypothetical protein